MYVAYKKKNTLQDNKKKALHEVHKKIVAAYPAPLADLVLDEPTRVWTIGANDSSDYKIDTVDTNDFIQLILVKEASLYENTLAYCKAHMDIAACHSVLRVLNKRRDVIEKMFRDLTLIDEANKYSKLTHNCELEFTNNAVGVEVSRPPLDMASPRLDMASHKTNYVYSKPIIQHAAYFPEVNSAQFIGHPRNAPRRRVSEQLYSDSNREIFGTHHPGNAPQSHPIQHAAYFPEVNSAQFIGHPRNAPRRRVSEQLYSDSNREIFGTHHPGNAPQSHPIQHAAADTSFENLTNLLEAKWKNREIFGTHHPSNAPQSHPIQHAALLGTNRPHGAEENEIKFVDSKTGEILNYVPIQHSCQ